MGKFYEIYSISNPGLGSQKTQTIAWALPRCHSLPRSESLILDPRTPLLFANIC